MGAAAVVEALIECIQKNTQLHDSSGPQPPRSHLLSPKAQCALSRGLVDAMWAAANGEALNLGRLGALMMLTHVSRLLQGREFPGSILAVLSPLVLVASSVVFSSPLSSFFW